jgi:hypothetical protein
MIYHTQGEHANHYTTDAVSAIVMTAYYRNLSCALNLISTFLLILSVFLTIQVIIYSNLSCWYINDLFLH